MKHKKEEEKKKEKNKNEIESWWYAARGTLQTA
jgi:hypothetical protein